MVKWTLTHKTRWCVLTCPSRLYLDVVTVLDVLLDEHPVVAKAAHGLSCRPLEPIPHLRGIFATKHNGKTKQRRKKMPHERMATAFLRLSFIGPPSFYALLRREETQGLVRLRLIYLFPEALRAHTKKLPKKNSKHEYNRLILLLRDKTFSFCALLTPRVPLTVGDPHPLAAAPGASLDHDRIADLFRYLHRFVAGLDKSLCARRRKVRI